MSSEILAKLSSYQINKSANFETITAQLLARGSIITPKPEMKAICRQMINYISTNNLPTKEMKTYFEYSCLVAALLLMNRVIIDEYDKIDYLTKFERGMDKYDMARIRKIYFPHTEKNAIKEIDPNIYSSVRLSADKKDLLNLFSIDPLDNSLWFNWKQSNNRITNNTKTYIERYTYLFTKKPKVITLSKLFSMIHNKDIKPRIENKIKETNEMIYKHEFTDKEEITYAILESCRNYEHNTNSILWQTIQSFPINVSNSNITVSEIDLSYIKEHTILYSLHTHKIKRSIVSKFITNNGIIEAIFDEGTIKFMALEKSCN